MGIAEEKNKQVTVETAVDVQDPLRNQNADKGMERSLSRFTFTSPLVMEILVIAFIIVYSLIGMRNFELRMANLHEDDGPIFYALAFKNPIPFAGDFPIGFPVSLLVPIKVITSTMVWLPALVWRYLNVEPYLITWIITMAQGLLIGLSIYFLTLMVVRKRAVAGLAVIFGYIATPWGWDPANYGTGSSWTFIPYAAYFSLPPVLLAFTCLIREHHMAALVLLALAGFIHPNLTLYACTIVGIYWIQEWVRSRDQKVLKHMAALMGVGIITILPGLLVKLTLPLDPLPHDELMAGMRLNQHIWPWGYTGRWNDSLSTTLKWLVLAGLSWRWRSEFSSKGLRLWLAALTGVFLLSLTQIIGAIEQIPILLNFTGMRSFSLLALLSLPFIIYYWYGHIASGSLIGSVLSMFCLIIPLYTREYGLFWPLIVGMLLVDISQGHLATLRFNLSSWVRGVLKLTAFLIVMAWIVALLMISPRLMEFLGPLYSISFNPPWFLPGEIPWFDRVILIIAISSLGMIAWIFKAIRTREDTRIMKYRNSLVWAPLGLIIVLYGAGVLWTNLQRAKEQSVSSDVCTLEVQIWARENTPVSSLFVVPSPIGWRTIAIRRKFSPFTRESYAYVADARVKEHRNHLLKFYGISEKEGRELRGIHVSKIELDRFRKFKEKNFIRFAEEFGATHLVLPTQYKYTEATEFDLPLLYKNPYYVVYDLKQGGVP